MAVLELEKVRKSYHDGDSTLLVLHGVDLVLEAGESLALMGASGSGKSTLLQIAAGLERADSGEVRILGRSLAKLSAREASLLRRRDLGFVFQQFNLLPGLDVRDNLLFQRRLNGLPDRDPWLDEVVAVLGLGEVMHRAVERLSGGQQQRVAIARALAHRPPLIFADEPTGNLNDELSHRVMETFRTLVAEAGTSLLLVTHSREMAGYAARRVVLEEGRLHEAAAADAA